MASLSDAELLKIVNVDYGEYRAETLDYAKAEMDSRGLAYGQAGLATPFGLAILCASTNCRDQLKELIGLFGVTGENERMRTEMCIFFECIFFFIHMAMRMAQSQLSEGQNNELYELMSVSLADTAIETYYPSSLEEKKKN
jgi:hypothetical protein